MKPDLNDLPNEDVFEEPPYDHQTNIEHLNADFGNGWHLSHDLSGDLFVYSREPTFGQPACLAYYSIAGHFEVEDSDGNILFKVS